MKERFRSSFFLFMLFFFFVFLLFMLFKKERLKRVIRLRDKALDLIESTKSLKL